MRCYELLYHHIIWRITGCERSIGRAARGHIGQCHHPHALPLALVIQVKECLVFDNRTSKKLLERPRAPFIEKMPKDPGESVIWSGEPETPGVRKIIFWKSRPLSGRSLACSAVKVVPRVSVVVSTCGKVSPETSTFSETW